MNGTPQRVSSLGSMKKQQRAQSPLRRPASFASANAMTKVDADSAQLRRPASFSAANNAIQSGPCRVCAEPGSNGVVTVKQLKSVRSSAKPTKPSPASKTMNRKSPKSSVMASDVQKMAAECKRNRVSGGVPVQERRVPRAIVT